MADDSRDRRVADYRAVVFDWAGVLTEDPVAGLIAYGQDLELPDGVLPAFIRGDEEFSKVERGELSARDFLKGVCLRVERDHGVTVDIRRLAASMTAGRALRPAMLELIDELAPAYDLAVLTNNVAENREHLARTLPMQRLRFVLNSADLGLRKPDPLIYRELLDRLGHAGQEVVYIDDFVENLPPAADLGMTTIEFSSPQQLREELVGIGVLSGNEAPAI